MVKNKIKYNKDGLGKNNKRGGGGGGNPSQKQYFRYAL